MSELAKVVEETMWHIDATMEERGWDQNSELLMIWSEKVRGGGLIGVEAVPGWRTYSEATTSQRVALAMIGAAYTAMPKALKVDAVPAGLYAVALVSEAWSVRGEEPVGPVSESPNRFEVRLTYMQPLHGQALLLQHEKDGIPQMIENDGDTGAIPELLKAFAESLTC